MEYIKLAIITDDSEYGKALGMGLLRIYRNFDITLYNSQQLKLFKEDTVDLVLNDLDLTFEKGILLVEKPSMAMIEFEHNRIRLYKYDHIKTLAGHLLFIYGKWTGRRIAGFKNQDMNLFVFGAAEGGCGCTSVALAVAQELKRFYKKEVLYLSLEELESTLEYMQPLSHGRGISEYLYGLLSQKQDAMTGPFLESFLIADAYGVEAFMPSPGRNLLTSLTAEEIQYFISALMNAGRYDYIMIDSGCSLNKAAICCYEMANKVCIVTRQDEESYRVQKLMEYLIFIKGDNIVDKMGTICNDMKVPHKEKKHNDRILKVVGMLPSDPTSFEKNQALRQIRLDRGFGLGIKRVTSSLLKNQWI